ncbi:MAG: TRAP transporter small permease [Thiobacillaceae bacterium]
MAVLLRLKQYLIAIEKTLAGFSLFLLLAFSLAQIIARNFFDYGFSHLDIVSRHLVLYLTFMGAALVTEDDRHIKIDILAIFVSDTYKPPLNRALLFMGAVISALFAWHALRFWLDEWHFAATFDQWQVLLALILPLGFGMLALHFLLCGITGQAGLVRHTP